MHFDLYLHQELPPLRTLPRGFPPLVNLEVAVREGTVHVCSL